MTIYKTNGTTTIKGSHQFYKFLDNYKSDSEYVSITQTKLFVIHIGYISIYNI